MLRQGLGELAGSIGLPRFLFGAGKINPGAVQVGAKEDFEGSDVI